MKITTNSYIAQRIQDLESRIAEKSAALNNAIDSKGIEDFRKAAQPTMDRAFARFCVGMRDRIISMWRYEGLRAITMGRRDSDFIRKNGRFRLISVDSKRNIVRYPALAGNPCAIYDRPSTLDGIDVAEVPAGAYLAFCFDDREPREPACISDAKNTFSARPMYSLVPKKEYKREVTQFVRMELAEQAEKTQFLLSEYETFVHRIVERESAQAELMALESQIKLLQAAKSVFAGIYLPAEATNEVIDQMLALAGPRHAATAVLFKGPAGTGKTLLANNVAKSAGAKFIKVGTADLKVGSQSTAAEAVKALWNRARASKPCILFLDEIDGLFPNRSGNNSDRITNEITNAFLSEWDGKEEGIWVMGATNRRDVLDNAILSRFGIELEFALPDEVAREAIFRQELASTGYSGGFPANVGRLTQGMSGRDLAMLALRMSGKTAGDFVEVVRRVRSAANPNVDQNATWESLIVSDDTKASLQTVCGILQNAEEWAKRGVNVPRGILIEGPPGTGKTHIARTVANEGGLGFVKAAAADLKGQYQGHSAANVRDIFEKARAVAPSILFIDELDILAPARGATDSDTFTKEIVSQLLQEMDGIVAQKQQVMVLAATNHPEAIDSAILSRFVERIAVPLPSPAERVRLVQVHLDKNETGLKLDANQLRVLAEASHEMSHRDIGNWFSLAQRAAVVRAAGDPRKYKFQFEDLLDTSASARSSAGLEQSEDRRAAHFVR